MIIPHLIDIFIIIALLLFLGFCHFCAGLRKSFWRCPKCGFTRPYKDLNLYNPNGPYCMERTITSERCDRPTKECINSKMMLYTRKWSWWLSRPFAWIWSPFTLLYSSLVELFKKNQK